MSETLTIKNFGPIKDIKLEFKKVNIFIGDQGTGKSTVAKIIVSIQNTFFRELFNLELNEDQNKETQLFVEYLKTVDIYNFLRSNTKIYYEHPAFKFEYKNLTVFIQKKRDITFLENMRYNVNYIPAERSSVTVLSNSLYALIETGTSLPRLFLRFGDKFLKARKEKTNFDYSELIGVKFIHSNDSDSIQLDSGKLIPFNESSSGIQSAITLLTVYDSIVGLTSSQDYKPFISNFLIPLIIEEPEISCFPSTQNQILKYIISNLVEKIDYKSFYKNQLIITTHSPYVLTSLNNMMYAYKVGQLNMDNVDKIIEKKYWLNPDDVSVYMMLKNGKCEDIFDREEGLIKAEKIDSVTNTLNEQFSSLLNLEFSPNELDTN